MSCHVEGLDGVVVMRLDDGDDGVGDGAIEGGDCVRL